MKKKHVDLCALGDLDKPLLVKELKRQDKQIRRLKQKNKILSPVKNIGQTHHPIESPDRIGKAPHRFLHQKSRPGRATAANAQAFSWSSQRRQIHKETAQTYRGVSDLPGLRPDLRPQQLGRATAARQRDHAQNHLRQPFRQRSSKPPSPYEPAADRPLVPTQPADIFPPTPDRSRRRCRLHLRQSCCTPLNYYF